MVDEVFVIFRIIKAEVGVISWAKYSLKGQLIIWSCDGLFMFAVCSKKGSKILEVVELLKGLPALT